MDNEEISEAAASPAAAAPAAETEGDEEDPLLQYPEGGGYWSLPPGQRLRMLLQLCYDALGTTVIRFTGHPLATHHTCSIHLHRA